MKLSVKFGYLLVIGIIIILFYREYNNYKIINQKVSVLEYKEKIDKIKNNAVTIENYYKSINDQKLKQIVEVCYLNINNNMILKLNDNDFVKYADIYNIYQSVTSGGCYIGSEYQTNEIKDIYSSIKYEQVIPYEYTSLDNNKDLNSLFEATLDREEQYTSAFIKSVNILLGEEVSNNE